MIDLDALKAPFPADELDWRVGNRSRDGKKTTLLAYLTARAVMDRLDEVCGVGGWQVSYTPIQLQENPKKDSAGHLPGFLCTIQVWTGVMWISKSDVADTTDIESLKGGVSGSLKRTAVLFGIGRYLYQIDQSRYYPILEGYGPDGSIYAPLGQDKSPGHVVPPRLPAWALPAPALKPKAQTTLPPTPLDDAVKEAEAPAEVKPTGKSKKGETKEEKAARQETHDPSWDADAPKFFLKLKDLEFSYDEISDMCAWMGRPRPSQLPKSNREALLIWLGTSAGADHYTRYLESKGK